MTRRTRLSRRLGVRTMVGLTVLAAATGCDFQPADLPVPGAGVGGPTYRLHIEFATVLNLPQGAKVIADGVRVGQLASMTVVNPVAAADGRPARKGYVIADVDVRDSVHLPVGTTAELRQETPLGDVHIALTEPAKSAGGQLEPGATIPLSDTAQSASIEDILAGLATFIGSGAITDMQSIVQKMNSVMPADPHDTARIAGILGSDLSDLGDHLESVDAVLDGLTATATEGLQQNLPALDDLLTPYGVQHTTDSINAQIGVIYVLTALGPLAPAAQWLGPLLKSLDGTVAAVVPMLFGSHPLDTESPSNMKALIDLIQNKLLPFAERGPKVNLVGVTLAPSGDAPAVSTEDQTSSIVAALRMIGVVR